jgi:biotin-(acetyl-CoA carboxylase) ligase
VALFVAVMDDEDDMSPGLKADRTTLYNEGCGFIDIVDFMERFGRHFMYWINRWQEDGFEPVRDAWLARESGFGEETRVYSENRHISGRLVALDSQGGAVLETEEGKKTFPLGAALRSGSWSLADLSLK